MYFNITKLVIVQLLPIMVDLCTCALMYINILLYRLLTGLTIDSLDTAKAAMTKLHEMGAKTVVISSTDLGSDDLLIGLGSSCHSTHQRMLCLRIM